MEILIRTFENPNQITSNSLLELKNEIVHALSISVDIDKIENKKGVKDGGLVIGLTIVGLALTGISTLISIIQYWEQKQLEKQEKYQVSINLNNNTYTIENLQKQTFLEMFETDLTKAKDLNETINIVIRNK